MKLKVTRNELAALSGALRAVGNLTGKIKFSYALAKNSEKIDSELKLMDATIKPTEKYKEYDKERVELCKEHAAKDDNGMPKMTHSPSNPRVEVFVGLENNPKFDKAAGVLKAKYKGAVETRETTLEKYGEVMDEEIKFELHMIQFEDVPENITGNQLRGIVRIIEGEPKADDKTSKSK